MILIGRDQLSGCGLILQHRNRDWSARPPFAYDIDLGFLFDRSAGRGVAALDDWPEAPAEASEWSSSAPSALQSRRGSSMARRVRVRGVGPRCSGMGVVSLGGARAA